MWTIEVAVGGRADYFKFHNAEHAEAFRTAAQNAEHDQGRVETTLWYAGRSWRYHLATDIAHYYERYTQSYVLYGPDGKAIWEDISMKGIKEWAKDRGIKNLDHNRASADHWNRGD